MRFRFTRKLIHIRLSEILLPFVIEYRQRHPEDAMHSQRLEILFLLTFYWSGRSLTWLRTLRTILRTALLTVVDTSGIQGSTYNVVPYPWKIFYPTTPDQYDRVLLQVVTFTRNVGVHLFLVRQAYPCHFPKR